MYRIIYLLFLALLLVPVSTASAALPDGWSSQDIGDEGQVGSADYVAGTFTVNGSGHDIWDNSDDFHYCYTSVSGDTTISARVVSITNGTHDLILRRGGYRSWEGKLVIRPGEKTELHITLSPK